MATMRKVFLTLVVVLAFAGCTNGQGLLNNTLTALLKLLQSLLTQTSNLTSSLLINILGVSPLTTSLNKTISSIVKDVNSGLGVTVQDVQNLLKALNINSILQLPLNTLLQLAKFLNITAIVQLEQTLNKTLTGG